MYATSASGVLNTNINQVATGFARGPTPTAKSEPEAEATVLRHPVRRRSSSGFVHSWRVLFFLECILRGGLSFRNTINAGIKKKYV